MEKQPNAEYCFVCGLANPSGLKATFYQVSDTRVVAHYVAGEEYQGYPGVLHGGITSALLDEVIERTLIPTDRWAMTAELQVRFLAPVPIGQPITVEGELVRLRSRTMEGRGRIVLADGTVAATAEAKYILLSPQQAKSYDVPSSWQDISDEVGQ
ncbi:MAG: PaaI family thioesterase [Anaerolineales bacterium]